MANNNYCGHEHELYYSLSVWSVMVTLCDWEGNRGPDENKY